MKRLGTILICFAALFTQCIQAAPTVTQEQFVNALASDSDAAYDMMHPALQKVVDETVLATLSGEIKHRLGKVKSVRITKQDTVQYGETPADHIEATVEFEKGEATSVLEILNGQLVSFDFQSQAIQNWLENGLTSVDEYRSLGSKFIRKFLGGQTQAAWNMMHASLQAEVDESELDAMMQRMTEKSGDVVSVRLVDSSLELSEQTSNLLMDFEIVGKENTITCEINIAFAGMQGHLLGFHFK